MTVDSKEKQGTQAQSNQLKGEQNQLGDDLKDLRQQKASIVDPAMQRESDQQSSGKHGLDRSQWIGDL